MTTLQMIMPVSLDPQFEEKVQVIQTLAKEYRFQARLPIPTGREPEFDLQKTIDELNNVDAIVVDLSFERPSCYYELGIAEALGLQVFVISLAGSHIHQTSHKKNVQFYKDLTDYKKILIDVIKKCRLTALPADAPKEICA